MASSVVADFVETVEWEDEGLPLPQVAIHKHNHIDQHLSLVNRYGAFWGDTHTVAGYNDFYL